MSFTLPPLAASPPVDCRVLVRPARLYKQFAEAEREAAAAIAKQFQKQAEAQFKDARQQKTPSPADFHERAIENMRAMEPLRAHQGEIANDYARKARQLLPPPAELYVSPDAPPLHPAEGWFVVDSESAYIPLTSDVRGPKPYTIGAASERSTFELVGLAPNTFFEVQVVARRRTDEVDDAHPAWSPPSTPLASFTTPAAPWMMSLEKAGLRSLIEPFTQRGLTAPDKWVDMPQGVKLELGIDAAVEAVLADVIAREGIVTPAEEERLARERTLLARTVDELLAEYRQTATRISVGDAVVDKSHGRKRRFGVVTEVGADALSVRWDAGVGDPANLAVATGVKPSSVALSKFDFFLSHAQAEAQNQVAHLSVLLRDRGAAVWFDQDSERLEARDMVRGVANSDCFVLYLTRSYLDRFFCRLEWAVADALQKPVVVVYEPDERFGGAGDYVKLVEACTRRQPQHKVFLLKTEAIPMARRAFQRRATVDEICKRARFAPSLSRPSFASPPPSPSVDDIAELRRALVDMRMEINDLRAENALLWEAVKRRAADE